jgi:uncharacterized Fe-S radical SAM superfamily protein PflX
MELNKEDRKLKRIKYNSDNKEMLREKVKIASTVLIICDICNKLTPKCKISRHHKSRYCKPP